MKDIELDEMKNMINENYTYYNTTLNKKFWKGYQLDERIRRKLLTISVEFYKETKFLMPIVDVILTGSVANFNYNEYSDFDLHILVDFTKMNDDVALVKMGADAKRVAWNNVHDIQIQGHDVEVYIQDIREVHTASGEYSLLNNKWLIKPEYNAPEIDEIEINKGFKIYKERIERLVELSKKNMTPEQAKYLYNLTHKLKKHIHGLRKTGLLTDKAEFSVGNLIFKKLRNSQDFGKIIDVIHLFYDKIYAQ